MSRFTRNLLVVLFLAVAAGSFTSTFLAHVVHAEDVDCSLDENKDNPECKN